MANIVFEDVGPAFRVPGLPYEETYELVNAVILDDVPAFSQLEDLLKKTNSTTLVAPWSFDVLNGLRDYVPTTFKRTTANVPPEIVATQLGTDPGWIPDKQRVLLQLQSEIDAKAATVDAAIINTRRDRGTVVNKAHTLNRLYNIGRIYEHLGVREYPMLFGDLTNESHWDDALSEMKMTFVDFMMQIPQGERRHEKRYNKADVSSQELKGKYVYLEWLKEKLGDNLVAVLNYGSAARTDDPALYTDFDNWVRVRDIPAAHKALRGTYPVLVDGKVIHGKQLELSDGTLPEEAKHIGIHIFPESEDYVVRHIKFLHDSREFLQHTRVVYGEFPFIKVRQDEVIERGVSQAYIKLKTIAGSLNWAYWLPQKIVGKPALFEYIVKNVRFFLQHSLNATEGPRFRSKEELTDLLAQRGLHVPKYRGDLRHIQESIVYSLVSVLQLQKEFIHSDWKPSFDFLREKRTYKWDSPNIDNWSKCDDE